MTHSLKISISKKPVTGGLIYETPISKYPDSFISSWIIPNWGKIVDIIEADPNRLPF